MYDVGMLIRTAIVRNYEKISMRVKRNYRLEFFVSERSFNAYLITFIFISNFKNFNDLHYFHL